MMKGRKNKHSYEIIMWGQHFNGVVEDKNLLSEFHPTDSKHQLTDPDEPILVYIHCRP